MTFKNLLDSAQYENKDMVVAAKVGNQIHELADEYNNETNVQWLDLTTTEGREIYKKSLIFLMTKAFYDIYPDKKLNVRFSLGHGVYVDLENEETVSDDMLTALWTQMFTLIQRDIPFNKVSVKTNDAIELCNKFGMPEKALLFAYRRTSSVNLYELDGYYNYLFSDLAYSTGVLTVFNLVKYQSGFLLLFPDKDMPNSAAECPDAPKLCTTLRESANWTDMMQINSIGELNQAIVSGKMDDIVLIQEAFMDNKIAAIAENIINNKNSIVLIAGPSSSGKTSFSNRLSVHLRKYGYNAHPIACDDYFKNRKDIPFGPDGLQDLEALSVVDLDLLEHDMEKLQSGEEINLPHFNFASGEREYHGNMLKLGNKDIIVMEGIHCLNPQFLPNANAYRVYISALTTLNMDNHNRISSSDLRLLRRMARDARHRNINPTETIQRWQSVRAGEEKNIFPYQELADVVFNSSFVYEIPMMKNAVEALLFSVDRDSDEWLVAKKLLKFLDFTLGCSDKAVPNNSILREFLGGSCFNVG